MNYNLVIIRVNLLKCTLQWLLITVSCCVTPPQSRYRPFPSSPKVPCASLRSISFHHKLLATTDLFSTPVVLPFPKCHINEIIPYADFSVWLFSVILLRFITYLCNCHLDQDMVPFLAPQKVLSCPFPVNTLLPLFWLLLFVSVLYSGYCMAFFLNVISVRFAHVIASDNVFFLKIIVQYFTAWIYHISFIHPTVMTFGLLLIFGSFE